MDKCYGGITRSEMKTIRANPILFLSVPPSTKSFLTVTEPYVMVRPVSRVPMEKETLSASEERKVDFFSTLLGFHNDIVQAFWRIWLLRDLLRVQARAYHSTRALLAQVRD